MRNQKALQVLTASVNNTFLFPFCLCAILICFLVSPRVLRADDILILKSGRQLEGKLKGLIDEHYRIILKNGKVRYIPQEDVADVRAATSRSLYAGDNRLGLSFGYFLPSLSREEENVSLDPGTSLGIFYSRIFAFWPSLWWQVGLLQESFKKEENEPLSPTSPGLYPSTSPLPTERLSLLGGLIYKFPLGKAKAQALRAGVMAGPTQESVENSITQESVGNSPTQESVENSTTEESDSDASEQGILFSVYVLAGYEYHLEFFTLEGDLQLGHSPDKNTALDLSGISLGISYRF